MTKKERIGAFSQLGFFLQAQINGTALHVPNLSKDDLAFFSSQQTLAKVKNPWFSEQSMQFAIQEWATALQTDKLNDWIQAYSKLTDNPVPKKVGVIMAGNIPLVGFHDMLSVLISGHTFIGKLSSKDDILLKALVHILLKIEPRFESNIQFIDGFMKDMDAVIATGSNNSSRYFEYYFKKYPHIIRKNRHSIAILNGNESDDDLQALSKDIFLYFGLGCRNVSKLFLPKGFDTDRIFKNSLPFAHSINHNKYANNYTYNRSIYLMNLVPFLDNGFLILKEDSGMSSPISVVYYEFYDKIEDLLPRIRFDRDQIQCIVSNDTQIADATRFGQTQLPQLNEYADDVDTLHFLTHE